MSSTLTALAMDELADLLKLSRRKLADIYREYRLGSNASEIAHARGLDDPRAIEETLSALRILFGRQSLPKRAGGRQQALNEAEYWLNSEIELSDELYEHFYRLLVLGKRTNQRQLSYEAPTPPKERAITRKRRKDGADGRQAGIYVITRKDYLDNPDEQGRILLKIGYSHSVWERIDSAQTWFPEPLEILRVYLHEDPQPIEKRFHIALDAFDLGVKEGGGIEWFNASLELIDSLANAVNLRDCSKDASPIA